MKKLVKAELAGDPNAVRIAEAIESVRAGKPLTSIAVKSEHRMVAKRRRRLEAGLP